MISGGADEKGYVNRGATPFERKVTLLMLQNTLVSRPLGHFLVSVSGQFVSLYSSII